jgi:hypothetical protein
MHEREPPPRPRRPPLPPPIEAPLESALLAAGLMRKENFGALHKVRWSRSSRTDKHVHALAAVVALKAHCALDAWEADPEGLAYADAINRCVRNSLATCGSPALACLHLLHMVGASSVESAVLSGGQY